MQYFIKPTLSLYLALLLVIGLSLVISHLQPVSLQFKTLEFLHLLDCQLPCWIGIIPGKTTISEARILLESTYPSEDYEITLGHNNYDGTDWLEVRNRKDDNHLSVSFNIWQSPQKQTENTVIYQVTVRGTELTLGEWYYVLGRPQALSVTWGNHYAVPNLLYNRQHVRLTLNNKLNDFAVDNPSILASTLDIYDQIEWGKTYSPHNMVMWRGFSKSNKDELITLMLP